MSICRGHLPQVTLNRYGQKTLHAPLQESSALYTTWSDRRISTSHAPIFARKMDVAIY